MSALTTGIVCYVTQSKSFCFHRNPEKPLSTSSKVLCTVQFSCFSFRLRYWATKTILVVILRFTSLRAKHVLTRISKRRFFQPPASTLAILGGLSLDELGFSPTKPFWFLLDLIILRSQYVLLFSSTTVSLSSYASAHPTVSYC